MAYVPNNLTVRQTGFIENTLSFWIYMTAADSLATITGSFYFSDGDKKGMKVGDIVDVIATTGPKCSRYQVTVVTKGSGATVAAPTAIT